ncbi:MAG: TolC family protein [Cyclobacteriaceae bacterium]|nr:TolC family protein [Cyclobacteriaceae bacterium]
MKHVLVLVTVLTSFTAYAQRQLSYEEAVQIALQKNVDYNVQQNEVVRAEAQKLQGIMGMAPSARLNSDYFGRRGRQQVQNPETSQVEFPDVVSNNLQYSIGTELVIFNGLNRLQTFRSNINNLESQEFALERSRQNTIFNVAQQYLQVLLSDELYRIATDNHRNQEENLKRIEGQVEVGALAITDKYNQLAEVKRLENLMIRAKNTFQNDKLVLAQTLQLGPGTDFVLLNPGFNLNHVLQLQIDLDDLYQVALTNRPDYNQQRALVARNSITVSALRGSYFPTLSAFYTYGSSYNSRVRFSGVEQLTTINAYQFYGLTLSVPILNGFNTRTRVYSAKLDRENSLLNEQNLKTVIYRDVTTAYQNFEAAKAGYLASLAQFEAANIAYSLEKERYELGASAFFEFSQAANALIQAQAAKAQSEYTLMFQETILNYQVGQLR